MDKAAKKNVATTYDVTCGDGSSTTVTTVSPRAARDAAEQKCETRNGVQAGPEARPWQRDSQ
ncbi:MAG TPA: hypothetical protein VGK74_16875 [Symbiobacteriaceae bacterium]|jgi:hypothetical protein